ncbi:MAG: EMC3/TMCO1 family protein [Candidatus Thermoplasmatota archaeon]|jgi:uncharacterized membrane protein (DUF106 family)|nr:EMC3/TMCO1 family protein [Candidatus Thermoplasmatota archaeon]MCL5962983.1 EMC3/TMCO1 family protein [Candidatus Thermoplasmatota archaeon]
MVNEATKIPVGKDQTAEAKPAASQQPQQTKGAPPPGSNFTFIYIFLFLMAILIMLDASSRNGFVSMINQFLYPVIGFNGRFVVISILILSMFFMFFITSIRNYHTDWVVMAKSQKWGTHLSKLQMKYMREGKKDKVSELKELQQKVAELNMKVMGSTLKYMSLTLFFIILFLSWIAYLVSLPTTYARFAVPWNFNSSLLTVYLFPTYIILYSIFTIPFSMLFYRLLKHVTLLKEHQKYKNHEKAG